MLERLMVGKRQFSTILANKNSVEDIKCHAAKKAGAFEIRFEVYGPLKVVGEGRSGSCRVSSLLVE